MNKSKELKFYDLKCKKSDLIKIADNLASMSIKDSTEAPDGYDIIIAAYYNQECKLQQLLDTKIQIYNVLNKELKLPEDFISYVKNIVDSKSSNKPLDLADCQSIHKSLKESLKDNSFQYINESNALLNKFNETYSFTLNEEINFTKDNAKTIYNRGTTLNLIDKEDQRVAQSYVNEIENKKSSSVKTDSARTNILGLINKVKNEAKFLEGTDKEIFIKYKLDAYREINKDLPEKKYNEFRGQSKDKLFVRQGHDTGIHYLNNFIDNTGKENQQYKIHNLQGIYIPDNEKDNTNGVINGFALLNTVCDNSAIAMAIHVKNSLSNDAEIQIIMDDNTFEKLFETDLNQYLLGKVFNDMKVINSESLKNAIEQNFKFENVDAKADALDFASKAEFINLIHKTICQLQRPSQKNSLFKDDGQLKAATEIFQAIKNDLTISKNDISPISTTLASAMKDNPALKNMNIGNFIKFENEPTPTNRLNK